MMSEGAIAQQLTGCRGEGKSFERNQEKIHPSLTDGRGESELCRRLFATCKRACVNSVTRAPNISSHSWDQFKAAGASL